MNTEFTKKKTAGIISFFLIFAIVFTCAAAFMSAGAEGTRSDYSLTFAADGYTHSDKYASYNKTFICDVSSYNGTIDWDAVYASGIDGVMLRVGYRGYKTGTLNQDTCFETYYAGAKAAGLKVGAYFYGQPVSISDAITEADFVLGILNSRSLDMPVAYDIEYAENNGSFTGRFYEADMGPITLTSAINAFCSKMKNSGYDAMLYINVSLYKNNISETLLNYPIWVARYASSMEYDMPYEMWQYTSSGSVNGISGRVDMSVLYTEAESSDASQTSSTEPTPENPAVADNDDTTMFTEYTTEGTTNDEPMDEPDTALPDAGAEDVDVTEPDTTSFWYYVQIFFEMLLNLLSYIPVLIGSFAA